jgi:DNA-binding NtrC family response regulator
VLPISERSLRRIMAYRWPGNIRELANTVERATLLADGPELEIELPESPSPGAAAPPAPGGSAPVPTRDILLDLTLEQLQRLHIMHALESSEYRVFGPSGAAEKLDINPNTLLSRMDRFGIPRPRLARRIGDGAGA